MPKDMTVYKTPILTGDKQYLVQLVVCDLLSNVVIALLGFISP